ncbi:hypothetical protein ACFSKN_00665 [Mariniflexile gromovii]|uniref:Uncharacterized protein n=1 Tax=Mariniflexile gromovii TaxID=362523 RepID=A0ABS4BSK1_9FLAO|nr:hypothetical protein [Mariniflexile gromovii]MBP0903388.1 hypothetical protein [Mariniflexile gromovii]
MYKLYVLFLSLTLTLGCFAQEGLSTRIIPGNSFIGAGSKDSQSLLGLNIIEYGRGVPDSQNNNIEGSVYLFKGWNNLTVIWFDDKIMNVDLVNYNLLHERFEFKLNNDSIITIDPAKTKLEKVSINNRVLKPYYNKELFRDSYFEILWHSDEYSLLSNYKIKISPGAIDPLTKTYTIGKKYIHNRCYYVKKNNEEDMTSIKLRKSEILKLIDVTYVDQVKKFVKKSRLKYNNLSDVKDILIFYNSIKT